MGVLDAGDFVVDLFNIEIFLSLGWVFRLGCAGFIYWLYTKYMKRFEAKLMEDLEKEIRRIILSAREPIDISKIAKRVNKHWFTVSNIVWKLFFEEIEQKAPETLKKVSIRPLKTTKSFVFIAQKGNSGGIDVEPAIHE
jgi:hypothetical protein